MAEHPKTLRNRSNRAVQAADGRAQKPLLLGVGFIGWYILVAFTGGLGWVFLAPDGNNRVLL